MRHWQIAAAVFLAYLAFAALIAPRLTRARRLRIIAGSAGASAVLLLSRTLPSDSLANLLFLPAMLLFLGYWVSGWFFVRPMRTAERWLIRIDEALHVQQIAARVPRPIVEVVEFAYAGIYLLIPAAMFVAIDAGVDVDRFWTTIITTDAVCFGFLPWLQTRPPRAVGFPAPWRSSWRPINLLILETSSIKANTFPSGHAAEALAAALLLTPAAWPITAGMFVSALAVTAGAVFGRYHYAADALAGWAVALLVYAFV